MMHPLKLIRALLAALALLPALAAQAATDFVEGQHYLVLQKPVETSAPPGKVEVVELFWYGCPHCYRLEPVIEEWLQHKPAQADFVRIPAALGPSWELGARVYYATQVLGVTDKTHQALFDAVHRQHRNPTDEQAMADVVAAQGVDRDAFLKALHSFDVDTRLRKSKSQVLQYRITGVPAIVIAGKYVSDIGMAGSPQALVELIDFLVAREAAAAKP